MATGTHQPPQQPQHQPQPHPRPDPNQGGRTPFEQIDQQELLAMVQNSDPARVMEVGRRLQVAAQKMTEVGDDLLHNMSSLDWEGAAAESFKDWGRKVAQATDQLATYAKTAGDSMLDAGVTLDGVKHGMPELPRNELDAVQRYAHQPNKAVGDAGSAVAKYLGLKDGGSAAGLAGEVVHAVDGSWVTDPQAKAAQAKVDSLHQESVDQMSKLGQAYELASDRMSKAVPPTFPPTPLSVMPPQNPGQTGPSTMPTGPGQANGGDGHGGQAAPPAAAPHPAPPSRTGLDQLASAASAPASAPIAPAADLPASSLPSATGTSASPPSQPSTSAPASAPPSGTAQPQSRPPASGMGMMPGGLGGAHGGGGGSRGGSRGRGMTSTAGGEVGGRRGPSAGGEFTAGGSGLRSRADRASGEGRAGQSGAAGFGSSGLRKDRRKRPEYRYDDEESWTTGTPESNPGVIE